VLTSWTRAWSPGGCDTLCFNRAMDALSPAYEDRSPADRPATSDEGGGGAVLGWGRDHPWAVLGGVAAAAGLLAVVQVEAFAHRLRIASGGLGFDGSAWFAFVVGWVALLTVTVVPAVAVGVMVGARLGSWLPSRPWRVRVAVAVGFVVVVVAPVVSVDSPALRPDVAGIAVGVVLALGAGVMVGVIAARDPRGAPGVAALVIAVLLAVFAFAAGSDGTALADATLDAAVHGHPVDAPSTMVGFVVAPSLGTLTSVSRDEVRCGVRISDQLFLTPSVQPSAALSQLTPHDEVFVTSSSGC
jgi:hypothetical protein